MRASAPSRLLVITTHPRQGPCLVSCVVPLLALRGRPRVSSGSALIPSASPGVSDAIVHGDPSRMRKMLDVLILVIMGGVLPGGGYRGHFPRPVVGKSGRL